MCSCLCANVKQTPPTVTAAIAATNPPAHPPAPPPPRCGAVQPSSAVLQQVEFRLASYMAKEAARGPTRRADGAKVYTIPTYVYNVVTADGRGAVPDETLRAQVDELNKAYATAVTPDGAVSNSGQEAGIAWKFDLQAVVTVKAGDMCDNGVEKGVKAANRKGGKGALNLYITDLTSCGLLGYSSWPWELDPKSGKADPVTMDGVVIHHETLPGGSYKPYNMGRTCIHETGHWMGLYHVFQNGGWGWVVWVAGEGRGELGWSRRRQEQLADRQQQQQQLFSSPRTFFDTS